MSGCCSKNQPAPASQTKPDGAALPTWTAQEWSGAGEGRRRLVVLVHGGGGPNLFTEHARFRVYPEALAQRGYDVIMPRYFEAGPTMPTAVSVLRAEIARARVERRLGIENIGVVGFSRGGYVTLLAAVDGLDAAAIVEFYGGLSPSDAARLKSLPPTLILHGEADDLVPVTEARSLEALFRERSIRFESKLYPDQGHGFRDDALTDSIARMTAFLDANVALPK